jgi:translation initiation factor IF-3
MAQEQGLDLVEVSPDTRPPVCKLMDFGRHKYDQSRAERERKKKQTDNTPKEVRFRPTTDTHDMNVKIGHAEKFLIGGHKVKLTVRFRGREMRRQDVGRETLRTATDRLKEVGKLDSNIPEMQGRMISVTMSPMSQKGKAQAPAKPAPILKGRAAVAAAARTAAAVEKKAAASAIAKAAALAKLDADKVGDSPVVDAPEAVVDAPEAEAPEAEAEAPEAEAEAPEAEAEAPEAEAEAPEAEAEAPEAEAPEAEAEAPEAEAEAPEAEAEAPEAEAEAPEAEAEAPEAEAEAPEAEAEAPEAEAEAPEAEAPEVDAEAPAAEAEATESE